MKIVKGKRYFEFEELMENVQEKVLDNLRDYNTDEGSEWEDMDFRIEKLEELGFESPEIHYTGFWSQGDGACFTCHGIDIVKFMKKYRLCNEFRILYQNIWQGNLEIYGNIYHSGHYYHEKSHHLELEYNFLNEISKKREDKIYSAFDKLQAFIEEEIVDIAKDIYRSLEKDYEALSSDSQVSRSIIINELLFEMEGDLADREVYEAEEDHE